MAEEGRTGEAGTSGGTGTPQGQGDRVPDELVTAAGEDVVHPSQSPLFHAQHAPRYERQRLLEIYQETFSCRAIVMVDVIFPFSINVFEELIYEADPKEDLHLILASPGGDGETAVRLARSAQARCRELTVIVPDQAKSAGTILAMGAHRIIMGPTSDLGPVDPQFQLGDPPQLVSAKDLIAAVDAAEAAIQEKPETYPLHAAMLADVNALMVQQARSALARIDQLVLEALMSNPSRTKEDAELLRNRVKEPLIDEPKSHAAIIGPAAAAAVGLPVEQVDPCGTQWQMIWRLWTKYWAAGQRIYEGARASQVLGPRF